MTPTRAARCGESCGATDSRRPTRLRTPATPRRYAVSLCLSFPCVFSRLLTHSHHSKCNERNQKCLSLPLLNDEKVTVCPFIRHHNYTSVPSPRSRLMPRGRPSQMSIEEEARRRETLQRQHHHTSTSASTTSTLSSPPQVTLVYEISCTHLSRP